MSTPFVHLHLQSHYSIQDRSKESRYLLLLLCLLFFIQGCTKEDKVDLSFLSEPNREFEKKIGSNGIYTIPVNLSKYNRRTSTKSSSVDTSYYYFCLDSMIDQSLVRQIYFEKSGWLYNQTPFKSNVDGIYTAIGASPEHIKDSLAKIKSFFLQVSNINTGMGSEYIVTMLPTKNYSTLNPGFDFLEKPSFCGIILYSDKDGNLLRTEYLKNGVINQCLLKPRTGVGTNSPHTKSTVYVCSECGGETLEPDGVCIFCKYLELNSIVIIGEGVNWDNYISMCLYELAQELGYIAPDIGGGGNGSDQGGGYIEDSDTKASIVCRSIGCFPSLLTIQFVTKGSVFSYSAPLRGLDNTCWFNKWNYDQNIPQSISIIRNSLVIQSVQESQTLVADYSTNNSCTEIAALMQDRTLKTVLDTLFYTISIQNKIFGASEKEIYSVLYSDSRGYQWGIGTTNNCRVPLYSSKGNVIRNQLKIHSHYHPSGSLVPSMQDLASLCMFFYYDYYDNLSSFNITTSRDIMVIRIKDRQQFLSFMNNYLIDTTTNNWHQNQTDILLGRFNVEYSNILKNSNLPQEQLLIIKEIIESMGLEFFWGTKITEPNTGSFCIQWNNTDFIDVSPIPLGCYTN